MGSSSSKPQYYSHPQAGYPSRGTYQPQGTYAYPGPSQGQFGYYYQQVGNDPTQVQAIPGYYYYPPQQTARSTRRKNTSTPAASNTLPRSPQREGNVSGRAAAASRSSPTAAPATGQPTESPLEPEGPSDAAPQAFPDAAPETLAADPVHEDGHAVPRQQPAPAAEPALARAAPELTNPLPNPPRDVFDTDAYRHIRRTQTTGSTGVWRYYNTPVASVSYKPHLRSRYRHKGKETLKPPRPHEQLKAKEQKSGGIGGGAFKLLRSFTMPSLSSNKMRKPYPPPPFYDPGVAYMYPPTTSGPPGFNPLATGADAAPPPPSGPPVIVPLTSPLNPTSSHKILYKKKLYPTAAHLFEAQKFLKHHPELADHIRTCSDSAEQMSMVSRGFQIEGKVRKDWPLVWRDKMDEVLYMKFTQHPDLRAELMATGYQPLLDGNEVRQPDAEGVNELGKALVRLRERLRREGAR